MNKEEKTRLADAISNESDSVYRSIKISKDGDGFNFIIGTLSTFHMTKKEVKTFINQWLNIKNK